jgi:hypothetical protein
MTGFGAHLRGSPPVRARVISLGSRCDDLHLPTVPQPNAAAADRISPDRRQEFARHLTSIPAFRRALTEHPNTSIWTLSCGWANRDACRPDGSAAAVCADPVAASGYTNPRQLPPPSAAPTGLLLVVAAAGKRRPGYRAPNGDNPAVGSLTPLPRSIDRFAPRGGSAPR